MKILKNVNTEAESGRLYFNIYSSDMDNCDFETWLLVKESLERRGFVCSHDNGKPYITVMWKRN